MAGGLLRILSCLILFGMGAEALHGLGEGAAVILSGIIAIGIDRVWKAQQHADARQQHREDVVGRAGTAGQAVRPGRPYGRVCSRSDVC
jgi:hypothetical protein